MKPFHGKIQFRVFWLLFLAMAFSAAGHGHPTISLILGLTPVAAGRAGRRSVSMGETGHCGQSSAACTSTIRRAGTYDDKTPNSVGSPD